MWLRSTEMKTHELEDARATFSALRRQWEQVNRTPSVLLVEDDKNDAELVKKKLQLFRVSVETVQTSLQAIEKLKAGKFDVALLDLRLNEGSGLDVLRFVKMASLDTILIVLTGVDDESPIIKEALIEGAKFVVQKPLTSEHLQVIFGTIT